MFCKKNQNLFKIQKESFYSEWGAVNPKYVNKRVLRLAIGLHYTIVHIRLGFPSFVEMFDKTHELKIIHVF